MSHGAQTARPSCATLAGLLAESCCTHETVRISTGYSDMGYHLQKLGLTCLRHNATMPPLSIFIPKLNT